MIIVNFVFFQICWCACVWGGANGYWWLGPLCVGVFLVWEMLRSKQVSKDLSMLAVIGLLGFTIDSAYILGGVLNFATPVPYTSLAPVWIVAMWIAFGLTLNHSMSWLKGRYVLGAIFGAIGGPFAYWVAWKAWSGVFFNIELLNVMIIIGIVWAIATPLLLWLAQLTQPLTAKPNS